MAIHEAPSAPEVTPDAARRALRDRYREKIEVNPSLKRSLVSYQSNRNRPFYRWFKYKEGFSAALVEYLLHRNRKEVQNVLDPFAGSGAALFASRDHGCYATGIELLPIGVFVVRARLAAERYSWRKLHAETKRFQQSGWLREKDPKLAFHHLPITERAFPPETEDRLTAFRTYVAGLDDDDLKSLFHLACLSVLEAVSYTRKDGQYLRWDQRSGRLLKGRVFDKGEVWSFDLAIERQLRLMIEDMANPDLLIGTSANRDGQILIREGSSLELLPQIPDDSVDLVITSPPYCNRYDYTRTYALELAYLGVDATKLKELRQALLSCTVENRAKVSELQRRYDQTNPDLFRMALYNFENQEALQEVLRILDRKGAEGKLNNANVPRMVRNYFLESSVVIAELARIVRPGGRVVMVNDNVQYAGEEVPVDLILSDIAGMAGFVTEHIWMLGRGKGNSSQQMGAHGRNELRKGVYFWRLRS